MTKASPDKTTPTRALQIDYVSWLLDPEKSPRTQQAWAEAHGITAVTVSRWKRDEYVLELLKHANDLIEPMWARALATLIKVATDPDHMSCVSAIRELGKLLGKYPSEKVDLNVVDRVAYVMPSALRDLSGPEAPTPRAN
jgi:hypothetical protein